VALPEVRQFAKRKIEHQRFARCPDALAGIGGPFPHHQRQPGQKLIIFKLDDKTDALE
jgi:hypothetical protein